MINTSVFIKCSNSLAICYIEHFVRLSLDKLQIVPLASEVRKSPRSEGVINSILQIGKLKSKQMTETIKHKLDWAKVVKGNNVIVGAMDVVSTRSWIEGFEFEIALKTVTVRVSTDKSKLAIATVELRALQNYETERIVTFDRKLNRIGITNDACRFEASISEMEFSKIKATDVLRIEVSNLLRNDIISVEFKTRKMLNALATETTREMARKALAEQRFMQMNLLFNLKHKANEYLKNPNITQDLEEQFEAMKLRLVNEVNDPRLLRTNCPRWKSYMKTRR
ncbi:MAG: hypothetical protein ACEY26_00275 [Candidatus Hodgkinia cicadicola]